MLIKKSAQGLPLVVSILLLSACGASKDAAVTSGGAPQPQTQAPPVREMQPLQPGQPAQQPEKSVSTTPAVVGGQPGTTPLPFIQPFRLGDMEYQFMAAKGKGYVGLETTPAMKPTEGNMYFLVRYQVIDDGSSPITVPNTAAVHLLNTTTRQVSDIDQAATNANVQSGATTGLPDQLVLQPGRPQIQSLAFQIPGTTKAEELQVLVTDPKDPTHVFQMVKLSN
jgi:hypothetical protein